MKKTRLVIIFVTLLALVALCGVLIQTTLYGCLWWECASQRPFTVTELALPDNLFPPGAIVNQQAPQSEGEGTIENGSQTIYWEQGTGIAEYLVFRFPSDSRAMERYSNEKGYFVDRKTKEPWQRPSTLTFTSTKADEFCVGCGYRFVDRCGMLARYREYVVEFVADIDSEMTMEDFEKIARFIDEQISKYLYP
jgi:hypothetical protein